jgi:hypothetical protein
MRAVTSFLIAVVVSGCAQLPPTPADIEAKRFQPLAHKAVIYVVRQPLDSDEAGWLLMDTGEQITTLPGTYYRWEVPPGQRRIMGITPSSMDVTVDARPGQIYFLRHTVIGTPRSGPTLSALTPVGPQLGQALVTDAQMLR